MEKIYNKIVRDNIPTIINASGKRARVHKLSHDRFKDLLKAKLLEEVLEFVDAQTNSERIEELADIKEVLTAISKAFDLKSKDINKARYRKLCEKGAFNKRYFLESVED